MRITFLDLDGVVNSKSWLERRGPEEDLFNGDVTLNRAFHALDPVGVQRLNDIVSETGTIFVISSTWRKHMPMPTIIGLLVKSGFEGDILGCTPLKGSTKGREIQSWLDMLAPFSPESFAIIDDDGDVGVLEKRLIRTNPEVGIQPEDVQAAIKLLVKK